jgi:hypothetical protein
VKNSNGLSKRYNQKKKNNELIAKRKKENSNKRLNPIAKAKTIASKEICFFAGRLKIS